MNVLSLAIFQVFTLSPMVFCQGGVLPAGDPPPKIIETKTSLSLEFPGAGSLQFLKNGTTLQGIRWMKLGGRMILSMGKDHVPMPVIEVMDGISLPPIKNWKDYLALRSLHKGAWHSRGRYGSKLYDLAMARFRGAVVNGNTVTLNFGTPKGPVYWVFEARTNDIGGVPYRGLGWSLEVSAGLSQAVWAYFLEPLPLGKDYWLLSQNWGAFLEEPLTSTSTFATNVEKTWGFWQPFLFLAGKQGSLLGWLENPVSMQIEIGRSGPHLVRSLAIPFGPGPHRSTPVKYWQLATKPLSDRWERLNAWTAAYDALAGFYRSETGIQATDPLPTYLWTVPDNPYSYYEAYRRWKERKPKTTPMPAPWLESYSLHASLLPEIAALGLRQICIQSPWHTDAEHSIKERVLPTKHGPKPPRLEEQGSGHAPWEPKISEAIGGITGLKEFVDRAHNFGVHVMLWTNPAHLSISSPQLDKHLDWLMWTREGVPLDEDYGDITGMSLFSGFYGNLLGGVKRVRQQSKIDGVWLDSFLTFGAAVDYSMSEPRPQLARSLDLERDLQSNQIPEIYVEGMSLLGLSTGGYGYEATRFEGKRNQEEWKHFVAIRGREYGLYRYVADTFLEPQSYYRALASKGVMAVFDMSQVRKLEAASPGSTQKIARANEDYLTVLPWMQRRFLIGKGKTWYGVAWQRDTAKEIVLFSFLPFDFSRPGKWEVQDVTAGTRTKVQVGFRTKAWHTYILRPLP